MYTIELTDGLRYEFTCENGHRNTGSISTPLYHLLYDSGANALIDGHTREAVPSFAGSLERFYEHCTRQILHYEGVDTEQVKEFWKAIASQSERQLGAFKLAYLLATRTAPPELAPAQIKFRNEMVHKGSMPTKAKTFAYGQAVLDHIRQVTQTMVAKYGFAFQSFDETAASPNGVVSAKGHVEVVWLSPIHGMASKDHGMLTNPASLQEWVEIARKRKAERNT